MKIDSPEERLLGLIKGNFDDKKNTSRPNTSAKRSLLSSFAKKISFRSEMLKPEFIGKVNMVLTFILIVTVVYFLVLLFRGGIKEGRTAAQTGELAGEVVQDGAKAEGARAKDYSSYEKNVGEKNLFTASTQTVSEAPVPSSSSAASKRFNLVGIITGDKPQAIVEDKEAGKTYYLYKGQSIGGITITDIGPGKVVLNYNGEAITLVL
jgi:hypothetical protein